MQQQRLLRQRSVGAAGCPHGTVLLPKMQLSLQAGDHICLLPNSDALFHSAELSLANTRA